MLALIDKKIASMPAEAAAPTVTVAPDVLKSYVATYRNDNATMVVTLKGDQLMIQPQGAPQPFVLIPSSETAFTIAEAQGVTFGFVGRGGMIERLTVTQGNAPAQSYPRVTEAAPSAPSAPAHPRIRLRRDGYGGQALGASSRAPGYPNRRETVARIPRQ